MSRLLIVQWAGDFREADRLRRETGQETYYGHGYLLDEFARLRTMHEAVGILCCLAPRYRETLDSGVVVMGTGADPRFHPRSALKQIEAFAPTRLVLIGLMPRLTRMLLDRGHAPAMMLADSFNTWYHRHLRYRSVPALLTDPRVTLVSNHGVLSSRALTRLGVAAERIVPWEYPYVRRPEQAAPRTLRPGARDILYVGTISAKKGVGDLLRAAALVADVRLTIVGAGQVARYERLAARLGIADRVTFAGLLPNDAVVARMAAADAVIVPSRHGFPEGSPMTLGEALTARTPVIVSDHPMMAGNLHHGEDALIFPAGDPAALASAVRRLFGDAALYARLSANAATAWRRIRIAPLWGDVVEHWARDDAVGRAWLRRHSVASLDAAAS